jgi:hypothetical protein
MALKALLIDLAAPLGARLLVSQRKPKFFIQMSGGMQAFKGPEVHVLVVP